MSDALGSTSVGRPANKRQEVANILEEAMQPVPEVTEEIPPTAEEEIETEVDAEKPASETIEAPDEGEQENSEEAEVAISTLSELAEAIEVDNDFLYNIKVPMPDEQEPVTLSELKDAYQKRNELTQTAQSELDLARQEFENEKQEYQQQLQTQQQQIQQAPDELLAAEAEVKAIAYQYQNIDWKTLEESDAGRAALEKQNLATAYAQAEAKAAKLKQDHQQQMQQAYSEQRANFEKNLLTEIAPWKDPAVRTKEATELTQTLASYGFNQNEINALADVRTVKLLRDFAQLRAKFSEADKARKVVMKTPKSLKPGAHRTPPSESQKLAEKIEAAKKSTDRRVKVSAISNLINSR